jgi:ankyrin repeat protein
VSVLGKHGAKPDGNSEPYYWNSNGRQEGFLLPPLYYAIYSYAQKTGPQAEATVDALLQNGANPNLSRGGSPRPLDFAAERGSCRMVKSLLKAGATAAGITDPLRLQKIEECRK